MSPVRTLVLSLFVVLSLFLVTPSQAQTCDPYRTRIPIDYRTYPTPEQAATFFATLDQGEPVEGRSPYVWRHDSQGWFWSCSPTIPEAPEPEPTPSRTLEVGKFYATPYGQVAKVIGIVSPVENTAPHWVLQTVTSNGGYCGRLGLLGFDNHAVSILREVPARDYPAGCPRATAIADRSWRVNESQ